MSFLRHRQIYQPMSLAKAWRRNRPGSVSTPIGSMSLQLAIPWQVALLQSLPPLHQPTSFSRQPAETVNRHHHKVGEFSPSRMRNFQPALTASRSRPLTPPFYASAPYPNIRGMSVLETYPQIVSIADFMPNFQRVNFLRGHRFNAVRQLILSSLLAGQFSCRWARRRNAE